MMTDQDPHQTCGVVGTQVVAGLVDVWGNLEWGRQCQGRQRHAVLAASWRAIEWQAWTCLKLSWTRVVWLQKKITPGRLLSYPYS